MYQLTAPYTPPYPTPVDTTPGQLTNPSLVHPVTSTYQSPLYTRRGSPSTGFYFYYFYYYYYYYEYYEYYYYYYEYYYNFYYDYYYYDYYCDYYYYDYHYSYYYYYF